MQRKHWILIVEDEKDILELIQMNIESHFDGKVGVIKAFDGLDASRRLPFQKFDCIITDLKMPKKDGASFIKTTRANPFNEHTPIIIVTGSPDHDFDDEKNFIYSCRKPIDFDHLLALIEKQLKLGKTDKRLDAELVNRSIGAVTGYFAENALGDVKIEKPSPKAPNQSIKGNFFKSAKIRAHKITYRVVFAFEEALLPQLVGEDALLSSYEDLLKTVDTLGTAWVTTAGKMYAQEATTNVFESICYTDREDSRVLQDKNDRGIVIPILCGEHYLRIYLFW